jgi:voltage-gated potassium channel
VAETLKISKFVNPENQRGITMKQCPFFTQLWSWLKVFKDELSAQNTFAYILTLAMGVSLLFGLVVFVVDPNIHSFWDGIWFAWVTMTHVGFGDVVPTSFLGRLLSSLLILFGLAVLAMLTASFSAVLIGREENHILQEIKRLHERLDQLEERLQK